MKVRTITLFILVWHISIHLLVAQNSIPVAVNDTMWTIPGYPVSVNALLNDYDPDGDTIYIGQAQLSHDDSILYFNGSYDYTYFIMDTIIKNYYVSDDPEFWYNSFDTGRVYIILDIPFYESLDVNNVNARFNNFGNHFWELVGGDGSKFFVPNGSKQTSLLLNTFWIGGLEGSGELHIAGELYRQWGVDYWQGPISDVYDSAYDVKWNRIWKLNTEDIEYHKSHWWENGYEPMNNIATWPGNGDVELGQSEQMAPFNDNNNDGIYDPMNGDYPQIKGDQALFFVFNDVRDQHTSSDGLPLGVEIRAMAYAFNEPADSALWHTIFLHYEIENKSDTTYQNTYVGTYTDTKIGNVWDDYVGCDVQGGFYFGYNGEEYDSNMNPDGGIIDFNYGFHPPAQAVMILGGPYMDEDGIDNPKYDSYGQQLCDNSINGLNFGDTIVDNERYGMTSFIHFGNDLSPAGEWPQAAVHYYNYLKGNWRDNSNCLYGGNGHINAGAVGPECNFLFPGNSDTCNWGTNGVLPNGGYNQNGLYWTDEQTGNAHGSRNGFGSSGPFTFKPGDKQEFDLAFVWARDYEGDRLSSVDLLKERCYYVKDKFEHEEDLFSNIKNQSSPENHLVIYPNPVSDELTIRIPQKVIHGNISIFNINGKEVFYTDMTNSNKMIINTAQLKQGLYILILFDGLMNHKAKFIKR